MAFNAVKYNEFRAQSTNDVFQRQSIRKVLSGVCDKKYDIVLDIGCNGGQLTALLDSEITVGHIYAIDISEDVITFAKQNHMKDNISYIVQDFGVEFNSLAPELKALEGKVSLIFSNSVFQFIQNLKNLSNNLCRLLSKGGVMFASVSHIFDPYMDLTSDKKTIHEKEVLKIPDSRTQMNAYIDAFKSVGFDVISDDIIQSKHNIKNDFFREIIMPIYSSVYKPFLVVKSEEAMKQLEDKLMAKARHFTDETTGEDMVDIQFVMTVFRVAKK